MLLRVAILAAFFILFVQLTVKGIVPISGFASTFRLFCFIHQDNSMIVECA